MQIDQGMYAPTKGKSIIGGNFSKSNQKKKIEISKKEAVKRIEEMRHNNN